MKVLRITGVALFALAMLVALSAPASAAIYNFGNCITNNNAGNCSIGSSLSVEVTAVGTDQVAFKFIHDAAGSPAVITDIYFYDGTLLGIASLTPSAGVQYSQVANPGKLPGLGGSATAAFNVDPDTPNPIANAIGYGEDLTITFNLLDGKTFADTIAALANPWPAAGGLLIGIHVQSYANGGSESFTHVPEPGFYGLLSMGLAGLGFFAMRRRRSVGPQAE